MTETVFKFKAAAHFPSDLDPQAVGERLETLPTLTPEVVVQDAKNKRSPLHLAFEWDDSAAAEQFRLDQARYLIRNIVTVVSVPDQEDREVRAFVPVTVRESEEKEYIPIARAMNDEDYRQQVLDMALNEFLALRRKYQDYEELARVFRAIDAAAKQLRAA